MAISKNKGDIMEEDPFFEGSEDLSFFQAFLRLLTLPILFVVAWYSAMKWGFFF